VVAHGGEPLKYAAWAVPRGTRLVYYKIGTVLDRLNSPIRRLFHAHLTSRADCVVGISAEMAEEARNVLGVSANRISMIPNGRDPSAFTVREHSDSDGPVRLVSVGHIDSAKRPEWFAEVVSRLTEDGVEVLGTWVGDGPMLSAMRRAAPPNLEFVGRRDDVPKILAESDVFILTSTAEGMPGVLIEAGLAALPTVTTDVPGARTVVADGETGFVVSVDDPDRYVECAERLAASPQLRRQMGTAARDRCMEQFTLTGSLAAWEKQLSELLAGDTT
jgi:glycosyltransferase involved in cell wall biosynthesis